MELLEELQVVFKHQADVVDAVLEHSDGFCRVNRRQNESGVLRGGKFFRGLFLTEVRCV